MHDGAFALDVAVHREKLRAQQFAPLAVAKIAPYDHVGRTCFVFQRDEYDAARGVGPLAADDDSRGADEATVRRSGDLGRGEKPLLSKAGAQEGERMPAQRERE